MSKPKLVLISDGLHPHGIERLKAYPELFQLDIYKQLDRKEILEKIRKAEICIIRSSTRMDRELIEAAKELKLIARAGIGTDNIDLHAASERGILVFNTPQENANATAEHVLALSFALIRHIPSAYLSLQQGVWDRKSFQGIELSGKKFGLIGFGLIAKTLAPKLQALGVELLAYDPYQAPEEFEKLKVKRLSLDEILKTADILSLHIPLTDETRGLFGENEFFKMKAGSYFINCARGGIVDEKALLKALDTQHIAGAAIDVFEKEPPNFPHPLIQHPRVICTPHLGAQTEEARRAVSIGVAERLIEYFEKAEIRNLVNPEALERRKS